MDSGDDPRAAPHDEQQPVAAHERHLGPPADAPGHVARRSDLADRHLERAAHAVGGVRAEDERPRRDGEPAAEALRARHADGAHRRLDARRQRHDAQLGEAELGAVDEVVRGLADQDAALVGRCVAHAPTVSRSGPAVRASRSRPGCRTLGSPWECARSLGCRN
nr:hypothetical protein [Clavibacter michiganensis]